jgi:hypothetical protein
MQVVLRHRMGGMASMRKGSGNRPQRGYANITPRDSPEARPSMHYRAGSGGQGPRGRSPRRNVSSAMAGLGWTVGRSVSGRGYAIGITVLAASAVREAGSARSAASAPVSCTPTQSGLPKVGLSPFGVVVTAPARSIGSRLRGQERQPI